MQLKPNPFTVGEHISDPMKFIGRHQLLESVTQRIRANGNVSIIGERRTGKSSLLRYLSNRDVRRDVWKSEAYIPIYLDFQSPFGDTEKDIWVYLASEISDQMRERSDLEVYSNILKSDINLFQDGENRSPYLMLKNTLISLKKDHYRLVLLMDELDQLFGKVDHSFFTSLRSLIDDLSYVTATRIELSEIEVRPYPTSSTFFSVFITYYLAPFSDEDVRHLIYSYVIDELDANSPKLANWIWGQLGFIREYTGFHPFFVQLLCYLLYEDSGKSEKTEVTQDKVLRHFEDLAIDHFLYYWDHSTHEERQIIWDIAHNSLKTPINKALLTKLENRCLVYLLLENKDSRSDFDTPVLFSKSFAKWIIQDQEITYSENNKHVPKELHILTGGKGGVGKTLLSLSSTLAQLSLDKKVLCIDLNWENGDFSRILQLDKGLIPVKSDGAITYSIGEIIPFRCLIARPDVQHTLPDAALGFWDSIRDVLRICYDRQFDPDCIVVDTGLHCSSLIKQTSSGTIGRVLKRINTLLEVNSISHLNIWYVWTLASLHQKSSDPYNIIRFAKLFENGLDHSIFSIKKNFIQVVNPYALSFSSHSKESNITLIREVLNNTSRYKKLINLIEQSIQSGIDYDSCFNRFYDLREEQSSKNFPVQNRDNKVIDSDLITFNDLIDKARWDIDDAYNLYNTFSNTNNLNIDSLTDLANAQVGDGIDISTFVDIAQNVFQSEQSESIMITDQMRDLGKAVLFQTDHKRPQNLFLIPMYDPEVVGFTDRFIHTTPQSINDISRVINKIIEYIGKYLNEMSKIFEK
jgi:hypothetical protein